MVLDRAKKESYNQNRAFTSGQPFCPQVPAHSTHAGLAHLQKYALLSFGYVDVNMMTH